MRYLTRAMLVLAALPAPSLALAQDKPAESADDYLCIFAGKCGAEGEAATAEAPVTRDAPALKGFCLACPNKKAADAGKPAAAAPPPRRADASAAPARPARAAAKPARATYASAAPQRASASSAQRQGPHADLRLTFEYNSATLTGDAQERAKKFAEALLRPELADRRFAIEGHTDSAGGRAYNIDLSERRAQAVVDFLVGLGVSRDRLETHGYGPDRPIDGMAPSAQQNRRVEAVLVS